MTDNKEVYDQLYIFVKHGNLRWTEVFDEMTAVDRSEYLKRMAEEAERTQKESEKMSAKMKAGSRKAPRRR